MFGLGRLIAGKLAAGRFMVLAASALLGGLVVTGVLAGPGGLLTGSGDGSATGDQAAADATATPTPQPGDEGLEVVGDVIDCPVGEDTRFKFEQNGSEFEVTGLLVSLDESSVVVTGPEGNVTAAMALNTEVKGDPQPGDAVKVEGAVLADGTFVAREVKPACEEPEPPEADDEDGQDNEDEIVGDVIDCPAGEDTRFKFEQEGDEFEVTGLLVSLTADTVVVTGPNGDVTATLAADVEIEGDPQSGDPVKVAGAVLGGGSFEADEVEPACGDEDDDEQEGDGDHSEGDDGDSGDGEDEQGDHGGQQGHDDNDGEGHEDSGEHNSASED